MMRQDAGAALQRALEISEQIVAVADGGDVGQAVHLDLERLQLLKSVRAVLHPMDERSRSTLREIAMLNDRAVGLLEHRRRAKGRDLDMATVGRRAVAAYARVRMQR